jgi:hypothetical protein
LADILVTLPFTTKEEVCGLIIGIDRFVAVEAQDRLKALKVLLINNPNSTTSTSSTTSTTNVSSKEIQAAALKAVPFIAALLLKKQLRTRMSKMKDAETDAASMANGSAATAVTVEVSQSSLVSHAIPVASESDASSVQKCQRQYTLVCALDDTCARVHLLTSQTTHIRNV